jgi:preprotein translocase SecE subunit
MDVSPVAYRYALAIYLLFMAFAWYSFHAAGLFMAQYVVAESASGFSVANPDFPMWNNLAASVLTVVVAIILFTHERLKEYVVDVGDEMTRVSWTNLQVAQKSTGMVLVLVILSSIFLFAADLVFLKLVNFLIGAAA